MPDGAGIVIASLALAILGRSAPAWLTRPIKALIDVGLAVAIAIGIFFAIHHDGEVKGAAKSEVKHAAAHAKTVADAVADTGKAQVTADAIGARVVHVDQQTTDLVRSKIKEAHDAIDVPPAPVGSPPAVVDSGKLSASLNALVDRANREAEAADAES